MIRKAKAFLRNTLCGKRIEESSISWQEIRVSKENVVCFYLSSNPLLFINAEGKRYYFRECPERQDQEQYILKQIDRFFAYIHNNQIEQMGFTQKVPIRIQFEEETVAQFRCYLEKKLADAAFISKIGQIPETLQRSNYSIWNENQVQMEDLLESVGLQELDKSHKEIAVYFVWYMRVVLLTRTVQAPAYGKKRYYYNALRSVATSVLAKELGVANLVTPCSWCCLQIEEDVFYGIVSEVAPGKRGVDADPLPTGILQRDLVTLNILDAICFQQDHGPNNYNVDSNGAVCAFDNDNPNTFFPFPTVTWPFSGCAPLVTKKGAFDRPYVDKAFAQVLLGLDTGKIAQKVKPYLNKLQIATLQIRIEKVRKALKRAVSKGNVHLLVDQWGEDTVQKEVTGGYGQTYLKALLKKCE